MMPPFPLLKKPKTVLFDLDGTLADSAPDLAAAINAVRIERGLDAVPYERLRPVASAGAPGLIKAAFQLTQQDALYATLRERFLLSYENNIAVRTTLFAGIPELLKQLRETGIGWGIVTNKVSSLTHPLVKKIGLEDADCVISGDTAARAKPYPDPLFAAADALNVAPRDCWFVGDDLRDITAGKSAGTATIAAKWGYCTDPETWGADFLAENPLQILDLINTLPAT